MLDFFLPIAHQEINWLVPGSLGFLSGFLAGSFGVSASFLVTPSLIILGINPSVAVASQSNQLIAIATSEAIRSNRSRLVDWRLLTILMVGNLVGAFFGLRVKVYWEMNYNYESFVLYSYAVLLIGISYWAVSDAIARRKGEVRRHTALHALPLKVKFRSSTLYISLLPVLVVGVMAGMFSYLLGIGGAFIVVPFCASVLLVPRRITRSIGIYQILFASIFATIAHTSVNVTGDALLVLLLLSGGLPGLAAGRDFSSRMSEVTKSSVFAVGTVLYATFFFFWFVAVAEQPVLTHTPL